MAPMLPPMSKSLPNCSNLLFFSLFTFLRIVLPQSSFLYELLPFLPWWLLITFGAYSLFLVGWRLAFFPECPEAFHSLNEELVHARKELVMKGFQFSK
jgi:dolichyl-phosphate mannosyltransferase polypeptide 3